MWLEDAIVVKYLSSNKMDVLTKNAPNRIIAPNPHGIAPNKIYLHQNPTELHQKQINCTKIQ